jgi:acetylornithine deacetylase/succinyl-diaminopimelate desuccinylase-like protein
MPPYIEKLPEFVDTVSEMTDTILTNLVLIGQVPSPTFKEQRRTELVMERLADYQADECTTDGYGNPIGVIRGTSPTKPPIFVVAHLDTYFDSDTEFNYQISENAIAGPGITDNSLGVAVMVSLPEIFRRLGLRFESDVVLAGVIQSMGKGNLRGIRHLVNTWTTPIRGAICIEGAELGRLNYYSDSMIRIELICSIGTRDGWEHTYRPNAILVLNEVINQVLQLRLPQRPATRVIFGRFTGGVKHGIIAYDARLGMEIQSKDDEMVKSIYNDIRDIVHGTSHEYGVDIKLKTISNVNASRLPYNHPLVKSAGDVISALGIKPVSTSSESELSILLSRQVPAITLGLTRGEDYHLKNARLEIEPMFKGIAQIVGTIMAIDRGVCDEQKMA